ncbi:unnamed protein product [Amaranthus hypochondriacus]
MRPLMVSFVVRRKPVQRPNNEVVSDGLSLLGLYSSDDSD